MLHALAILFGSTRQVGVGASDCHRRSRLGVYRADTQNDGEELSAFGLVLANENLATQDILRRWRKVSFFGVSKARHIIVVSDTQPRGQQGFQTTQTSKISTLFD